MIVRERWWADRRNDHRVEDDLEEPWNFWKESWNASSVVRMCGYCHETGKYSRGTGQGKKKKGKKKEFFFSCRRDWVAPPDGGKPNWANTAKQGRGLWHMIGYSGADSHQSSNEFGSGRARSGSADPPRTGQRSRTELTQLSHE